MVSHHFYQPCKVITADREVEAFVDVDEVMVELDVSAIREIRTLLRGSQC